jgi:hypothetical protein
MKNIYLISSDIPVRYYGNHYVNQNVYITSDEKFIRDEYVTDGIEVIKASPKLVNAQCLVGRRNWKKIILTTDIQLIDDGVQEIPDDFLKWFVDNPTCEEVEITRPNKCKVVGCDLECILFKTCENIYYGYEIIIPKKDLGYTTKNGVEVSDEMVRATMIPKDRFDDYHYKETFESRQYYIPKEEPKQDFLLVKEDCPCTDECLYYQTKQCKRLKEEPKQEFPFFDKEKSEAITKEGQKIVRELQSNIQQETLEEAFKRMQKIKVDLDYPSFHLGAKWQKEQFKKK